MVSQTFLQTFVLASIGLGSAVFVLVAVLPSILPKAIAVLKSDWETFLKEMRTRPPLDSGKLVDEVAAASRRIASLVLQISNMRQSLVYGGISALLFLSSGILGLWYLALPPNLGLYGSLDAPSAGTGDVLMASTFIFGALFMFAFATSFFRTIGVSVFRELREIQRESGPELPKEK